MEVAAVVPAAVEVTVIGKSVVVATVPGSSSSRCC